MTKSDTFTKAGAHRLARQIQEYWGRRGHVVNCTVIDLGSQKPADGRAMARCYVVRSDMTNGLPKSHKIMARAA